MSNEKPPDDSSQSGPVSDSSLGSLGSLAHEGRSVLVEIEKLIGTQFKVKLRDLADRGEVAIGDVDLPVRDIGRYVTIGDIALGGVGKVIRCRDTDLGRDVALKVIREEYQGDRVVVERFIEEAQVGGQLQHPGIVPVYELGLKEDKTPYFTMKLVKGTTLSEALAERSDPSDSLRRFLAVFEELCHAIAFAHSRGVVHRDIKPANIMLGPYGEVLVVDWGFAKVLSRGGVEDERKAARQQMASIQTIRTTEAGSQSVAGSVMGTPAYMPPEQARGRVDEVDRRSDVFALGAILTEILTGAPAYLGKSTRDVLLLAGQARLEDAHARLSACNADPKLVRIARGCLEVEKKDRPRSARVVANAIAAFQLSVDMRAHEAKLRSVKAIAKARQSRNARRLVTVLAAVVLFTVLGGVGALVKIGHDEAARTARLRESLHGALDEADRLADEGRRTGQWGPWPAAVEAARRAVALAKDEAVDEAMRERSANALAVISAEADRTKRARGMAAANRKLIHTLARIRNGVTDDQGYAAVARAYRDAFRDYGIDLEALTVEEASSRILASGLAAEVAPALDSWITAQRQATGSLGWQKILEVARRVDPDDWRNELRDAWVAEDGDRLRSLASRVEAAKVEPASLVLLGNALGLVGHPDVAVRQLRAAQLAHADDFWINHYLAYWLLQQEAWDETIRFSLVALALKPESPVTWLHLGIARGGKGDVEGEKRAYRRALDIEPDFARAWYNLAVALKGEGEAQEAIACLEHAISSHPGYTLALTALGAWWAEAGSNEGAITSLREAVRRGAGVTARLRLSRLLRKEGGSRNLNLAQSVMVDAVAAEPDNPDCHYEFGLVLAQRRQFDAAVLAFRKACELRPENGGVSRDLVRVLDRQGRLRDEMDMWRKRISADAKAWLPRYLLAVALMDKGDAEGAASLFQDLVLQFPKSAWPLKELAFAQKDKSGRTAAETYRRALEIDPDDAVAWNDLGATLHRLGEIEEAVHAYRKAIALDPLDVTGHYNLAFITGEQRRTEESFRSYENALRLDPAHVLGLREYVRACAQRNAEGDLERAFEAARRGLELQPKVAAHHFTFGLAAGYRYGPEEGLQAYRRLVRDTEPANEVGFLNNFAVALFRRGEREVALGLARRGIEVSPEYATLISNTVLFYAALDDAAGAIAFARERMRKTPHLAAVRKALVTSLGYVDDPDLAVTAWREAVQVLSQSSGMGTTPGAAAKTPDRYPGQAVGPPDVVNVGRDDKRAWTAARPDGGREWLELTYDPPLRAHMVRIHEVLVAGGVVKVEAFGAGGETRVVWEGVDTLRAPGVLELSFEATPFKVQKLRVHVDTARQRGAEEIDAVEIIGPDGRAWAAGAAASSVFGQNDVYAVQVELLAALDRRGKPGDSDERVALSLDIVRALPADPQSHYELGRAFGRHADPDRGEKVHRQEFPGASDLLKASFRYGMANGLMAVKKYQHASGHAFAALALNPDYLAAAEGAGVYLGMLGGLADAEHAWREKIAARNPAIDASFFRGAAASLNRRGRSPEAVAAWERAVGLVPNHKDRIKHLTAFAGVRMNMRDFDGAIETIGVALGKVPNDPNLHRYLGDMQFMMGDLEAAIRTYRGGLALTRYHGWMNYHLGIALTERGELEAGLDAIRRAPIDVTSEGRDEVSRWEHEVERLVELRPRASGILSGSARASGGQEALDYARLCWYSGYDKVAVRYFLRAFELESWRAEDRDAGNRYAAARAAVRAGKLDLARNWLEQELVSWSKLFQEDPKAFEAAGTWSHFRFRHPRNWFNDPVLGPVRDAEATKRLPEEQRTAWATLFAAADELLKRSRAASIR